MILPLLIASPSAKAACEREFSLTSSAIVTDNKSGLLWSLCLWGQSVSDCGGDPESLSWVDALNRARGAERGGIINWRMPRIEEIEQLYASDPECLAMALPGIGDALVWSSSANLDYATDAWVFDFKSGKRRVESRDSRLQLLLVSSPSN